MASFASAPRWLSADVPLTEISKLLRPKDLGSSKSHIEMSDGEIVLPSDNITLVRNIQSAVQLISAY